MMTNEFWDALIILGFILAAAFVIYVMLSF
jgi:hypothetical protein